MMSQHKGGGVPGQGSVGEASFDAPAPSRKAKKPKKRKEPSSAAGKEDAGGRKKARKPQRGRDGLTPAQQAVQEQMRKALEEDKYSAVGSIVDVESDDDDPPTYRGMPVRVDKAAIQQAIRKHNLYERLGVVPATGAGTNSYSTYYQDDADDEEHPEKTSEQISTNRKGTKKKKRKGESARVVQKDMMDAPAGFRDPLSLDNADDNYLDRDASIFGTTTGSSSNSTWVECDKCKKWRRLRGVVDEKKLPSKWFCSMNKNDPDRARCSAPEEAYEAPPTPESAADARARKHMRVWVRRLQTNELYETRQPTLTRGKKRAAVNNTKDAYEWIRCCNPSCGKWRAVLRIMDAKTNVLDRTTNGEWYCVMNNWDEKVASCAAPQENLPAVGCPPWVLQDE